MTAKIISLPVLEVRREIRDRRAELTVGRHGLRPASADHHAAWMTARRAVMRLNRELRVFTPARFKVGLLDPWNVSAMHGDAYVLAGAATALVEALDAMREALDAMKAAEEARRSGAGDPEPAA